MSTSLWWQPTPKDQPPPQTLEYALKRALAQRLWNHDGSLWGGRTTIGKEYIPYLEGLADGNVAGADELIGLIREHDTVELWIE